MRERILPSHAALAVLCLGQLMCILDISIVNIAIPSIQRELALAPSTLQWVVTAYVLAYGGLLLVGGRLADYFGRRKMLVLGLACFTLSSAAGGMAPNAAMLLAARAGQGVGGAIITPTVMSFVAGLYREGAERNWALGVLGAVTGAGFALGLVLGGLLTSTVGWRWVFFINVPIGLFVILGASWLRRETARDTRPVNIPGALLATAALTTLTYTLAVTDRYPLLSVQIVAGLAAAGVLAALLIATERRAPTPLIPAELFSHPPLLRAMVGAAVFGAITGPSTLFLTIYLQDISGWDAFTTGLAFLPQEAAVFLAATSAGRLTTRYGTRNVLAAGMVAFAVGSLLLTQIPAEGGYLQAVLPGLLFIGLGIGTVSVAGSIAATEGVASLQHGIATGMWNTGNQVGTALGIAALSAVASARTTAFQTMRQGSEAAAVVAGYRAAYAVALVFAVLGILGVLTIGRLVTSRGRSVVTR